MTDIAGDMSGIVGSGLALGIGAVTVGTVGSMMLDASEKMAGKKKRKRKGLKIKMPNLSI